MSSLTLRSTSPEEPYHDTMSETPFSLQLPPFGYLFNDAILNHQPSFNPGPMDDLFDDPPTRATRPTSSDDAASGNFIDLTADSSPPPSARDPPPRPASNQEPARKRRRIDGDLEPQPSASTSTPVLARASAPEIDFLQFVDENSIDEVDLTRVDNYADLEGQDQRQQAQRRIEEQQRQLLNESITSQNTSTNGSSKLSQLSCIICMESITDLTATHCGHIFCHTCIMEALIAGENQGSEPGKGMPRCPVCRKKVQRNPKGRAGPEVIPIEMKLVTRSDKGKGKERQPFDDPPIGD